MAEYRFFTICALILLIFKIHISACTADIFFALIWIFSGGSVGLLYD
jgi:hypothetical protein